MKTLLTLFLFILSSSIYAWIEEGSSMRLTDEMKQILEYSSIKEQYQSPDKKSEVILYRSDKTLKKVKLQMRFLTLLLTMTHCGFMEAMAKISMTLALLIILI